MRCRVIILLVGLAVVNCRPNIKLMDGMTIPTTSLAGTELNVSLDQGGVNIEEQTVSESETSDLEELKNKERSETDVKNGTATSSLEHSSELNKTHTSHEKHEVKEKKGFSFGLGGGKIYDKKTSTDDKVVEDVESGDEHYREKDQDQHSNHTIESDTKYNKTDQTHDHYTEYEDKSLNFGLGQSLFQDDRGSSDKHEEKKSETDSYVDKEKDSYKDDHVTSKSESISIGSHKSADNKVTQKTEHERVIEKKDDPKQGSSIEKSLDSNAEDTFANTIPTLKEEFLKAVEDKIFKAKIVNLGGKPTIVYPETRQKYLSFVEKIGHSPVSSHYANAQMIARAYENLTLHDILSRHEKRTNVGQETAVGRKADLKNSQDLNGDHKLEVTNTASTSIKHDENNNTIANTDTILNTTNENKNTQNKNQINENIDTTDKKSPKFLYKETKLGDGYSSFTAINKIQETPTTEATPFNLDNANKTNVEVNSTNIEKSVDNPTVGDNNKTKEEQNTNLGITATETDIIHHPENKVNSTNVDNNNSTIENTNLNATSHDSNNIITGNIENGTITELGKEERVVNLTNVANNTSTSSNTSEFNKDNEKSKIESKETLSKNIASNESATINNATVSNVTNLEPGKGEFTETTILENGDNTNNTLQESANPTNIISNTIEIAKVSNETSTISKNTTNTELQNNNVTNQNNVENSTESSTVIAIDNNNNTTAEVIESSTEPGSITTDTINTTTLVPDNSENPTDNSSVNNMSNTGDANNTVLENANSSSVAPNAETESNTSTTDHTLSESKTSTNTDTLNKIGENSTELGENSTKTDIITTKADENSTNTDVITTKADETSTKTDEITTKADEISTVTENPTTLIKDSTLNENPQNSDKTTITDNITPADDTNINPVVSTNNSEIDGNTIVSDKGSSSFGSGSTEDSSGHAADNSG